MKKTVLVSSVKYRECYRLDREVIRNFIVFKFVFYDPNYSDDPINNLTRGYFNIRSKHALSR